MPSDEPDDEVGPEWTVIDALAASTGTTVRNVRAYQARGLLPPPVVRARTGYYGPEHRARLELVKDLQGQGLKLDTIKRLFDTTGGRTEQVLDFVRAVREAFAVPTGQVVPLEELAARFRQDDPGLLKRAVKGGLLREVGGDQYEEVDARLVAIGQACVELGIPLERVLAVAGRLRRQADAVAEVYVDLFLEEVWRPFDASGRPDRQWPHVHESLRRLRGVSGEALLAMLDASISERLDVVFGRDITRTVRAAARPEDEPDKG